MLTLELDYLHKDAIEGRLAYICFNFALGNEKELKQISQSDYFDVFHKFGELGKRCDVMEVIRKMDFTKEQLYKIVNWFFLILDEKYVLPNIVEIFKTLSACSYHSHIHNILKNHKYYESYSNQKANDKAYNAYYRQRAY